MREVVQKVTAEVSKAVLDKDEVIVKVLGAILAQGHVLMEDVPGVGKTTMALSFARALGLQTKRIQFTADTLPSDVVGFSVYDAATGGLSYKPGAIMTNLLLADEMNRTSSKTQSALLEAMEERHVTIDGITHPLPTPFIVLATQNPVGSAGTQMLPNSQLDRFMVKTSMGYPSDSGLVGILKDRHTSNPVDSVQPVLSPEELSAAVAEASSTYVSDAVYEYIATLVSATRAHEYVELGVSPRGALALTRMTKAVAYMEGLNYVTPVHVQEVFADVCGHRLILNAKARLNEITAQVVLDQILRNVPVPQLSHENPFK